MLRGQRLSFGFGPAASALVKAGGSFCFSFKTGAKRSPTFSTRRSAAAGVKDKLFLSLRFTARSSSSQLTGMEMKGSSPFARTA